MTVAKRNKFLTALLLASIATTALFYALGFESTDFRADTDLFHVPQLGQVDSVVLQSAVSKTTLTYDGVRWKVNGEYQAQNRMITLLFATLEQVEPRRAVPIQQEEEIRSRLEEHGIHMDLHAAGELVGSFDIVGDERKTNTYFASEDEIYLVTIPGYRVYVAGIFELTTFDWREKRIFNFNWRNFKSLEARFPNDPAQGFMVEHRDGLFGITGMPAVDTTQLNNYLDAVSLVEASELVNTTEEYDRITSSQPMARIEVADIANRTYGLDVYPLREGRFLGRMDDSTLLILTADRWLPISRKRSDFRP